MADPFPPPRPTAPPVIVEKKRSPGCWGCGCGISLLILVLLGALVGGSLYFLHSKGMALTSSTASAVRSYDGGDAVYQSADKQVTDLNQRLNALDAGAPAGTTTPIPAGSTVPEAVGHPVTVALTADEINTLLARDPTIAATQVKVFVTLGGDSATIELSAPTDLVPSMDSLGFPKGRYINFTAEVSPSFDADTKTPGLALRHLRLGAQEVSPQDLATMQSVFDAMVQLQLQQNPDAKKFFDHLQSISIHDGKFVIVSE